MVWESEVPGMGKECGGGGEGKQVQVTSSPPWELGLLLSRLGGQQQALGGVTRWLWLLPGGQTC